MWIPGLQPYHFFSLSAEPKESPDSVDYPLLDLITTSTHSLRSFDQE